MLPHPRLIRPLNPLQLLPRLHAPKVLHTIRKPLALRINLLLTHSRKA